MPEALYEGVTSALVAPFSCRQENKKRPARRRAKKHIHLSTHGFNESQINLAHFTPCDTLSSV
uniref:Uncharacterized protein n=1 Tax=Klebsiella pneumoniae TaxID=573 RepID=A0A024HVF8_KLEPN|nr:hypothetical protein PENVA_0107 [Klebsiella pneumoniae]